MNRYFNIKYLHRNRWISYWYQFKEAVSLDSKVVLEVGPGNGIVANLLKNNGIDVKTIDLDRGNNPDYAEDISSNLSISENCFDTVLCCEVLEHLPYSKFSSALKNMWKISRKNVIITLPYTSKGTIKIRIHIPLTSVSYLKLFTPFPHKHIIEGEHYWEIGKEGYPLSKILGDIEKIGFKIKNHYPIYENPYHYMIICEK